MAAPVSKTSLTGDHHLRHKGSSRDGTDCRDSVNVSRSSFCQSWRLSCSSPRAALSSSLVQEDPLTSPVFPVTAVIPPLIYYTCMPY